MITPKFLLTLLVIFMLSGLFKVFGMASTPALPLGHPRQVDLGGNRFTFAMPENFSRDMPGEDLIERLDIDKLSLLDNPRNGNLIRRWWDIKEPGFFGKKLGVVMMDITVHKVPDNRQQRIHDKPYDIRDRLEFLLMLDESLHRRYDEHNVEARSSSNDEFTYDFPDIVYVIGGKLRTEYRDHTANQQRWTRYSVAGPNAQLIVGFAMPVTVQVYLEVVFTYSPNQNVVPRRFLEKAYANIRPIEGTFKLDYIEGNEIQKSVEQLWLQLETDDVISQHQEILRLRLFGSEPQPAPNLPKE